MYFISVSFLSGPFLWVCVAGGYFFFEDTIYESEKQESK